MTEEKLRLSKLLSQKGICSRREADRYIEMGMIAVDGEVITTLGTKVAPTVTVELLSEAMKEQEAKVTILLNKPMGIVSTQPEKGYRQALDLITPDNQVGGGPDFRYQHRRGLSVVGRLDIDSKGLLLLTQDGVLAKQIIGPDSAVEKEYLVRVEGEVTGERLSALRSGLSLDGKTLKRVKLDVLEPNLLRMILVEGKKRQIRRMCEQVGLQVVYLKRVRIGKIMLGTLPEGKWCYLESTFSVMQGHTPSAANS